MDFVNSHDQQQRRYTKRDMRYWENVEDGADIRNRYDTWAKELREFDKALKRTDLPVYF